MTASLPTDVQAVFDRFITTEFTTIDRRGQPITWPVTPYYTRGAPCIDVSTGLGNPKKADDARNNPLVALLFSDPTGSRLTDAPTVLVQGAAEVDDRDLEANRERYTRESVEKLPGIARLQRPHAINRFIGFYYLRIYIHVRPERVYVWPHGDLGGEPQLYDAHMEEVRSGHSEEPDRYHANPVGGASAWDRRIEELGSLYPTAVLSIVSPDGFPFAVRVPVHVDAARRWIQIDAAAIGMPLQAGLACLTAHSHEEQFAWQRNFQVRGDLVAVDSGWALVPHKLVGGRELPSSRIAILRTNAGRIRRLRRTAKRRLAQRV